MYFIYPTPSPQAGCDTVNFKVEFEFSFSCRLVAVSSFTPPPKKKQQKTNKQNKKKNSSLPYYLSITVE